MTNTPGHAAAHSPCVRICVVHVETGLCTGCLRRRDEIARWGAMSDAEREAILADLPGRRAAFRQRRGGRAGRLARRGASAGDGTGGAQTD
ncbi:MAG: DUF1289 domain-containing protein [Alphaproteobacteria bacterium]|nr:MAG: DUF1289 domain-containing protein [Alphaproteobacteria bacterium]